MKIKKNIVEKVLANNGYTTGKYSYKVSQRNTDAEQYREIYRLSADLLDTTAALSNQSDSNPYGWELVWSER